MALAERWREAPVEGEAVQYAFAEKLNPSPEFR